LPSVRVYLTGARHWLDAARGGSPPSLVCGLAGIEAEAIRGVRPADMITAPR